MVDQRAPAGAEAVRTEVRAWLAENWDPDLSLGVWYRRLADSGWGFPTWPHGWYGRDLDSRQAEAVSAERRAVGAPGPPGGLGIMLGAPTVIAHGTDEQKRRFLPKLVYGEESWCQLFSEPGSGSDLASLQTRAEQFGDEWIVNGQKVWTSGAQFAKWGMLIARTNTDVPKHAGITYFLIDMHQPGVEVRPLKEMTGGATFNEVFFTDARVPDENRLGQIDDGWSVALTTLANERVGLGGGGMGGADGFGSQDLTVRAGQAASTGGGGSGMAAMGMMFGAGGGGSIKMMASMAGAPDDPVTRQDIARLYMLMEISRFTSLRARAAREAGQRPGPEGSIGKLYTSQLMRILRDSTLRMAGAGGMLVGGDAPAGGMLQMLALFSPAISIAGGTDEVQRNIIGERVLGLPPEPRVDKDVPFRELKVGTQRES